MTLHIQDPHLRPASPALPAPRLRPEPLAAQAPGGERPRERLLSHGASVLTNAELLAIVLRTGAAGCPVLQLGQQLLRDFGGLRGLLQAEAKALLAVRGLGAAKASELLAISELQRRALEERLALGQALDSPARVRQYCIVRLGHLKVEHCLALFLDNRLRLIAAEEVARGTLSQASVYPREVVKAGLRLHCAALILAHNHPSGHLEASTADRNLTIHLKRALALVDIRLIDHLIVAGGQAMSMAEQGMV